MVSLQFPTRRSAEIARALLAPRDNNVRRTVRLDGRSAPAVAIRKRVAGYAKRLGKAAASEPSIKARLIELAENEVVLHALRGEALNGCEIDILSLARFQNTVARLRSALGLDGPAPEPPLPATLEEALAR